jgi:hypothetical protein
VPPNITIENTLFDFFRKSNLVEFKSEGDQLTLQEFTRNEIRTAIWFLQSGEEDYNAILNVYVVSRLPEKFLKVAEDNNVTLSNSTERQWLWQGSIGFQNVAIVVCRKLPLEKRYYKWLLFAPVKSGKWKQFIRRLVAEKNIELLNIARQMRPEEFSMITTDEIIDIMKKELSPSEREAYEKEVEKSYEVMITTLAQSPDKLAEALAKLPKDIRQAVLAKLNMLLGDTN